MLMTKKYLELCVSQAKVSLSQWEEGNDVIQQRYTATAAAARPAGPGGRRPRRPGEEILYYA